MIIRHNPQLWKSKIRRLAIIAVDSDEIRVVDNAMLVDSDLENAHIASERNKSGRGFNIIDLINSLQLNFQFP